MITLDNQSGNNKMPYWFSLLVAIDQLGNTIAAGNPDNTISARVGYFASNAHKNKLKKYWRTLEHIIDFTFEPIQGPHHCYNAWQAEADEVDTQGSYFARVILGFFVAVGCVVISAFVRLAIWVSPHLRYKPGTLRYNSWRQARQDSKPRHATQIEP